MSPLAARYAVRGEAHDRLPAVTEDWPLGITYAVWPWTCPDHSHHVALTVLDDDGLAWRTRTLLPFDPIHRSEADDVGVPFYGPSNRAMKGKDERKDLNEVHKEAMARSGRTRMGGEWPQADHDVITLREFDTMCLDCPVRLRISMPQRADAVLG